MRLTGEIVGSATHSIHMCTPTPTDAGGTGKEEHEAGWKGDGSEDSCQSGEDVLAAANGQCRKGGVLPGIAQHLLSITTIPNEKKGMMKGGKGLGQSGASDMLQGFGQGSKGEGERWQSKGFTGSCRKCGQPGHWEWIFRRVLPLSKK